VFWDVHRLFRAAPERQSRPNQFHPNVSESNLSLFPLLARQSPILFLPLSPPSSFWTAVTQKITWAYRTN
jgi:hypothetical protein